MEQIIPKELQEQFDADKEREEKFRNLDLYAGEDLVIPSDRAVSEARELNKDVFIINSSMPSLDKILKGFRGGQLIVLSAGTGQGKTSFAQTLTENFTGKGINCCWFPFEVPIDEMNEKFSKPPIFYLPRRMREHSLEWLEDRVIESVVKYECGVVFIDHLHYLLDMRKMAEAKSLSLLVGMMMRRLKRLAVEYNIIIFLIAHMKMVATDKLPELDDLRDSSFVGQESDTVLFLKRQKEGLEYTDKATLKVAKNRRVGTLGLIKLVYKDNKFRELGVKDEDEEILGQLFDNPEEVGWSIKS